MRALMAGILAAGSIGCSLVSWFDSRGIATWDPSRTPTFSAVWGSMNYRAASLLAQSTQSEAWTAGDVKAEDRERLTRNALRTRTEHHYSFTFTPRTADAKPKSLSSDEMGSVGKLLHERVREVVAAAGGQILEVADRCADKDCSFVVNYAADGANGTITGPVHRASLRPEETVTRIELHVVENAGE